eukprot:scaffold37343_cov51-Phaeocystis_antarctica.AAC.1
MARAALARPRRVLRRLPQHQASSLHAHPHPDHNPNPHQVTQGARGAHYQALSAALLGALRLGLGLGLGLRVWSNMVYNPNPDPSPNPSPNPDPTPNPNQARCVGCPGCGNLRLAGPSVGTPPGGGRCWAGATVTAAM